MTERALALDTAVLTLLVAGSVDLTLLGRAPHFKDFVPEDHGLLRTFCDRFPVLAVTPHVVTEAAHFLGKLKDIAVATKARLLLSAWLSSPGTRERPVPSRVAMTRPEFAWLDLADCSLLVAASARDHLLTSDSRLASRRLSLGLPTTNFNHLREMGWR